MEEGIAKGDLFLALETRRYDGSEDVIFMKGKIYRSEHCGCITDEKGNSGHRFTHKYWTQYLIKIGYDDNNNPCYDNPIAQKLNITRLLSKHGYAYNFRTNKIIKRINHGKT
jgi:hypothetical protein